MSENIYGKSHLIPLAGNDADHSFGPHDPESSAVQDGPPHSDGADSWNYLLPVQLAMPPFLLFSPWFIFMPAISQPEPWLPAAQYAVPTFGLAAPPLSSLSFVYTFPPSTPDCWTASYSGNTQTMESVLPDYRSRTPNQSLDTSSLFVAKKAYTNLLKRNKLYL